MTLSARKRPAVNLKDGAVNATVVLEPSPGVTIAAMFSQSSAARLALIDGKTHYAAIKASDVAVGVN
jgi:molybdopterin-binding protein